MSQQTLRILQSMCWPTDGMLSVPKLFLRAEADVALIPHKDLFAPAAICLGPQSAVSFGTWFNLFNIATWAARCDLQTLTLSVEGAGACQIHVQDLRPDGQTFESVADAVLDQGAPLVLDLAAFLDRARALPRVEDAGVLVCRITSGDMPVTITGLTWGTYDAPQRQPKLALSITTFRREAEVIQAAARFAAFRRTSWLKDHLSMIVVDNGQTLDADLMPEGVVLRPNANLGGAGGFMRGFLEARDDGATHVLFMDDDASIHMNTLERSWTFLAYAKRQDTVISGAMATDRHPWALWENSATFHGHCRSLHGGVDLTDQHAMLEMEWTVAGPPKPNQYGGWWYFAFPVAGVDHLAFPFFVRGDDVSFSLANSFDPVRLNGVVSYQDSFVEKESPLTWYLDLRSHLAHHLSLPQMEAGRLFLTKIVARFVLKNLVRLHYDSVSALRLALKDVLSGPQVFVDNIDMSARRADLAALTQSERWRDVPHDTQLPDLRSEPMPFAMRLLGKLTLNGHLIPWFRAFAKARTIVGDRRGNLGFYWLAARVSVMSADRSHVYTVEHSKTRAMGEVVGIVALLITLWTRYTPLKSSYQASYPELTSEAFWRGQLGLKDCAEHSTTPKGAPKKAGMLS